jgi:hypothetical protein
LEKVEVKIGVKKNNGFEVIDIMEEYDPYPALLGVY